MPARGAQAARALREQATRQARRARLQLLLALPLVVAVILAYKYRVELFGLDEPIRIVAAFVLAALGWWVAREVGRLIAPTVSKRVDVSNAGTMGFLIRLVLLGLTLLIALRIAGLEARSLALGGAFTAVILGLAAQNTLGNVLSGLLLISARPFKVGERDPPPGRQPGRADRGHGDRLRASVRHPRPRRRHDHGPEQHGADVGDRAAQGARPPSTCAPACGRRSSPASSSACWRRT